MQTVFIQRLSNPSPSDIKFTEEIVSTLNKPIDDTLGCGKTDSEKIWSNFHKIRSSQEYITKWRSYLLNINFTTKPIFYQHITLELFEQLLCQKLQEQDKSTADRNIIISYEEENAVRYMAGYVIRKLNKKHYSVDFLIEKDKDSIAETKSTKWVNLIDRGGLIHVTE